MAHGVDLSIFAVDRVVDPVELASVLRLLELIVVEASDTDVAQLVQDLLSVPNLFSFLMSVSPSCSAKLIERISAAFPNKPALILESFETALLLQLSHVLFSVPPHLLSTDVSRTIGQYRQHVEQVLPVLAALCTSDFTIQSVDDKHSLDDNITDEYIPFLKQKAKKQRRKAKQVIPAVDATPFHKFGVHVPASNEEAAQMANEIGDGLKQILHYFLTLLSNPDLAAPLRDAYIPIPDITTNETRQTVVQPANTMVVETRPSAYPMVQPMKAALYFDNADDFGEWRILIGSNATKKLRELRGSDSKKFRIVVKKIKQLSNGHFSDDNQKRLDGVKIGVPIFEAKMQRDLRLVYQVDCVPDHDGKVERQGSYIIRWSMYSYSTSLSEVIKIYGIYTHTQLNRIWDAMSHHLAGKGKEYQQRCTYRNPPAHPGDNVYAPATFPPEEQIEVVKHTPMVLSDQDMDQLHSLLVLEKYVTFSQAFINGLIANQDVQHVFELTPQERKIVECATSCYVLGRSGTGKTTTMLFKMLGIQRAWQLHSESSGSTPRPRQIFVTKSKVLATKVEEYFTKLLESLPLAGCTLEDLAKLKSRNMDRGLVDVEDDPDIQSGIPKRYSDLEDHHFPLFVTFDRLARMIAMDVLDTDNPDANYAAKFFIQPEDVDALDSFVTYDVFANSYWPHFPQPLTKGLDPWLVFGEIMGIIKGSEKSLPLPDGALDKSTYCDLPPRSNPTFANQRGTVYAIFEAYSKLKRRRRHHDVADRTHAILKTLLGGTPLKGRQVDYLYVDEAQDNLLIDALLLRLICRNPEGLFWAGDTAQTISAGSSFRFDDLKAFLYRIEVDQALHLTRDRSIAQPVSFQLAVNYRSHGGIVNCAHSVIELISRFWPNSIDGLQPEHGIVDGLKPVFFTGWDKDTVRYEQFLFGASHIEFGAQQCILVRNEEAKEKLRQQVGDIGTLYESKGLEFNDVLLYNFFEDSNVDLSRWRLVLATIDGESEGQDSCQLQAPCFERDESRYSGVCSELKLLYVGITRARKNMWIVDKSDKGEPMRLFWTARCQVQNCTPSTNVPHLAVSSTPEEWAEFGRTLFQHRRYTQAMHCFGRANMQREVRIAEAYYFRELARATMSASLQSEQRRAFIKAADAFIRCGSEGTGKDRLQYYRTAAECYVKAAEDCKAAEAYISAEEYDLAAKRYRKAGVFDKTVDVLKAHSKRMSQACADDLLTVCRLYYCSKDDVKPPSSLFSSFEEELEFLETYDLDVALVVLLENHGRYLQAADLHLSENKPLDAIRVLLRDEDNGEAARRAGDILLKCLWQQCPFGAAMRDDEMTRSFLSFSTQLSLGHLSPSARDQISMFQAAAASDQDQATKLEKLATSFLEREERIAALWCLDRFFTPLPLSLPDTLEGLTRFLREFYAYAHLLYIVASHNDPVGEPIIRQLFGITDLGNGTYVVHPGSFLPVSVSETDPALNDVPTNTDLHSHKTLTDDLRERLRKHLREKVVAETTLCYNAKIFSQCLSYIIHGACNYIGCLQQHASLSSLDSAQYNMRVGIHLQQMRILQLMFSAFPEMRADHEVKKEIAEWVEYLYEAFFPPFHAQGTIADLDWSSIPEASDGIRVMKNWVRGAIYSLDSRHMRQFFTEILRLTRLSFTFDEHDAMKYVTQANGIRYFRRKELFRNGDRYILDDHIISVEATQWSSISAGVLCLRYAEAPSVRDGYLRALITDDDMQAIPGLVHLIYTRMKHRIARGVPPRVKQLEYQKIEEIPRLLGSHIIAARSSLRVDAPTFVPRPEIVPQTRVSEVYEDVQDLQSEPEFTEASEQQHVQEDDLIEVGKLVHSADPTELEESAACRIQQVYRRYVQERERDQLRRSKRTSLEAERCTIFEMCLKHAQSSALKSGPYRIRFLGPLPHLLLALNKGIAIADALKAKTKIPGVLMTEGHERLEELGRQRSELSFLLKQGRDLRKKLGPESAFHDNRDMTALKHAIIQAKDFVQRIPACTKEVTEELNVALKAVVTEKKAVKKTKPSLNVDDLDPF
ncbi:hypothetical protein ID866_6474 [Astraeus odoratus]|nr:hypothetical protein ID866_6474 [Astraeus odoratus]